MAKICHHNRKPLSGAGWAEESQLEKVIMKKGIC